LAGEHETTVPHRNVLPIPGGAAPRIAQYEIEGELGRGGMGVVYRARDTALGRPVALKMILDPRRAGPEEVARFEREAKAAARLRHPGIVQVYGAGVHEGRPYIALELVQGESLGALLERGALPPRRVAEVVMKVARALAYAHSEGIIHRDVKPANVLIDREGEPRLMDFGLAREEAATAQLTQTGDVLGTPAYMAPEQATGDPGAQGPHTDVYALGAVLYRALVGRPPFEANNVQGLLYKILTQEPEPPRAVKPTVHADLETITLRCLEKKPEKRYANAGDVALELGRFLDGEPIVARPIGRVARAWRRARKNRVGALLVALLASVAAAPVAIQHQRAADRRAAVAAARDKATGALERFEEARRFYARVRFSLEKQLGQGRLISTGLALVESRRNIRESSGAADEEATVALYDAYVLAASALDDDLGAAGAYLYEEAAKLPVGSVRAGRAREAARAALSAEQLWKECLVAVGLPDPRDAEAFLDRIVAAHPRFVLALVFRVKVRESLGDLDGVIVDLTRLLELAGPSAGLFEQRAQARLTRLKGAVHDEGDFAAAEADLDAAIATDPLFGASWGTRGLVRLQLRGRSAEALTDMKKALELDPTLGAYFVAQENKFDRTFAAGGEPPPEGFLQRAVIREARGDRAGALADLRRFLEADPASPLAAEARRKVAELEAGH
jgi:tetratricopeptide (TPR) repeat protein